MRMLMCMPTRNVYVSDADLPVFERAAEIAGALSTAVAAGLRLYVDQQERARKKGEMRTVELEVQDGAVVMTKRFIGRSLVRYEIRDGVRMLGYRAYATERGQIAVHISNGPDWGALASPAENNPVWENPSTWNSDWWSTSERSLRVFPDLASMAGEVPDGLIDAVRQALEGPVVEDLDI